MKTSYPVQITPNEVALRVQQQQEQQKHEEEKVYEEGPRNKKFRDLFFQYYAEVIGRETQLLEQKKRIEEAHKSLESSNNERDKRIIELSIKQLELSIAENYAGLPFFKENLLKTLGNKWTMRTVLQELEVWKKEVEEKYEKSQKG